MEEEITVIIDEQGNPQISVAGAKGATCKTLTAKLEAALGNTTSDTKTKEFYERETTNLRDSARR